MVEVVSGAGNLEKLKFAVDYGADAVYLGGKTFNLRAGSENFTIDEMKQGIDYAKSKDKKVYVTLNIFARNYDFAGIEKFIKDVSKLNIDGFIVSDLGILSTIKELSPDIPIHISTQANITNYRAVSLLRNMGVKRIILARELSIDEIRTIREKVPDVELEVFVHGAMCMAYSGRCLLSNYLTYRDSNKGACAQCCRWRYSLTEEKRKGQQFEIIEDKNGSYILNSRDLCALPVLDKLLPYVNAIKIEGRIKSVYYTALTTSIYRRAVEAIKTGNFREKMPKFLSELENVSHRPYTTGFLVGKENLQHYQSSSYIRKSKFLAVYLGNNLWQVKNPFGADISADIITPDKTIEINIRQIIKDNKTIIKANPNYTVKLYFDKELHLPKRSILRTTL